ncbi:MAG TPA: RNA-binding cell elongation regulator Jag/EloR [Spirochaetota bacterium]|nr:RNA-binding cell elongation regulator Jag/EloR [Spirochaetota bacterium]HOL56005.1 RNA-binding cell elongation regulator Jag/EloR [Spirochaetota bacterium]HPP03447.1 RNA-binding cell elongation regulator Jag/EloR [Spirochaetota bacterium]
MIEREFTGKSEEEIIENVINTLKLKRDQFKIEFENKKGILSFGKKEIVAKVYFEDELLFGNRCLLFVKDLLERMNIEAKIYLIEEDDEKVIIEIESPDSALVIGKQGKNLEALQIIVNSVMNKDSNKWTKIVIDVGNYRLRREKILEKKAIDIANQVKKTKKSVLLEPMNPFERRIIHMTLKTDESIETVSEGDGLLKRVRVSLKENKG